MQLPSGYVALVLALWLAPLLACALPRLAAALIGAWRARGQHAALFIGLVIAACIYAYPSQAQKGTNGPVEIPAVQIPAFRLLLYRDTATERLFPVGCVLKEVMP